MMAIASSGNVGIGTTATLGKFQVSATNAKAAVFEGVDANGYNTWFKGTTAGFLMGQNNSRGYIQGVNAAGTGAADVVAQVVGGKFGVGTDSPTAKLDVIGDGAGVTGPLFRVASLSELFRVQENGNVGIGTTVPTAKLAISGTASISGQLSLWNSASISANLEVAGTASSSALFGSGLSSCTGSNKLLWSNGVFSCGTDLTGGGSGTIMIGMREGYSSASTPS
jgi:hypothetical protein